VYALLALLVAHAGAAFYHHYQLKDAVLRRMAPWIKPAG
jgi:cytochrome b561